MLSTDEYMKTIIGDTYTRSEINIKEPTLQTVDLYPESYLKINPIDPLYLFPLLINVLSNLYNFCKYNISQNMVELQYKRGDFKSFIKLFDWHTDFL